MKTIKGLLLLTILTGVQYNTHGSMYYAGRYALMMYLIQPSLRNQLQNTQILSPTPKGYNAALISPALLPLHVPIDTSFQLLNHTQKAPNFTPDPSTLLTAPSTVRGQSSEVVDTENSTAGYTDKQLKAIKEMDTGFHYFGATEKKSVKK